MPSLSSLPRPNPARLAVRITPDALRRVRAGHPWVFDESVTAANHEGRAGDLAVVFDADRKFAAIGLWDPTSPIRLKVLHQGRPVTIDRAFWAARLATALARRAPLIAGGDTTGYRVLNGENNGFPGLVLDRYDQTLVIKLYSAVWIPHLADLVPVIEEALRPDALVLRLSRSLAAATSPADLYGLEEGDALIGTSPDSPVLFRECGLTFEADVVHGQKTGHYLDQRDNRALAASMAAGARVLDVFSSTGGFTVHAAAGGAREVVAIDLSAPTLAAARRNLGHNGALPAVAKCPYRPIVGDAFHEMNRLATNGERFDMVIIDPPSFAQRQLNVPRALSAYGRLTAIAVRLVKRDGLLVQSSCSSRVSTELFHTTVVRAAAEADRPLDILRRTGHGIDHPVTFPEGEYLKAVFARVP